MRCRTAACKQKRIQKSLVFILICTKQRRYKRKKKQDAKEEAMYSEMKMMCVCIQVNDLNELEADYTIGIVAA